MVISDRTKGCCSSDLNEPPRPTMTNLLNLTHTTSPWRMGPVDYVPRRTCQVTEGVRDLTPLLIEIPLSL